MSARSCMYCHGYVTGYAIRNRHGVCIVCRAQRAVIDAERAAVDREYMRGNAKNDMAEARYRMDMERQARNKAALREGWKSVPEWDGLPAWGSAVMCPVG